MDNLKPGLPLSVFFPPGPGTYRDGIPHAYSKWEILIAAQLGNIAWGNVSTRYGVMKNFKWQ